MRREVPLPSIGRTDFACPNCGAHATQTWHDVFAEQVSQDQAVPFFADREEARTRKFDRDDKDHERSWRETWLPWIEKFYLGAPFLSEGASSKRVFTLHNVFVSECFNCKRLAIWRHDALLHPPVATGAEPASDMPDDVRADYEEARSILSLSPRGAAALLRLCVQKLCKHLGEPGKNIDTDIASLVAKGLDPMIGEALDSVRVIGNEAVHPGQMDLNDDPTTAAELFDVLNAIVEHTISRPRKLKEIFDRLPEAKRKAIEARNAKNAGGPASSIT